MPTATVRGNGVRLRKTPAGEIITELNKGVVVQTSGTTAGWTQVVAPVHGAGFIKAELLQAAAVSAPPTFDREAFFGRVDALPGFLSDSQRLALNQVLDACAGMPTSWTAYVLATAAHETGHTFDAGKEENLNYAAAALKKKYGKRMTPSDCDRFGRTASQAANKQAIANGIYGGEWGRKNLGNVEVGDGWKFRGRGWVQITGRANYAKAGDRLGLGADALTTSPDRVSELPICTGIVVRGMQEGWFRNRKLSQHLPGAGLATLGQFVGARAIINGGGDMDDEIASLAMQFQHALSDCGWTPV